jgi:acetyl esterase/lipase
MSSAWRGVRVWGLLTIGLLLITVRSGCAQSGQGVRETLDVVYRTVGGQELKLDIVAPAEGEGPFPGVVVIHGGAWRGGNKKDVRQAQVLLARRGYVTISPQYRLCPKEIFPAQVWDVQAAVRWLRTHAAEQKVDPERLGAMGFSAGGHLALLLGLMGKEDKLAGEELPEDAPSAQVQAVVNYFGPTELGAPDIPEVSKGLVNDFLGGTPQEKPELTRQASPVTYVSEGDGPVLTFQGTKDPLVPHTQAYRLTDAMTAAGVPGRVELLVGAGHGWNMKETLRTAEEAIQFFDQHLKKSGSN